MLCIDKSRYAASLLHFCYHMKCYGGLTAGLRTIYFDHTSLRNPSKSQCNIQAQGTGRNRLYIHIRTGISQLHHRSFTKLLLYLGKSGIQCLLLLIIYHLFTPRSNLCSFFSELIVLYLPANVNPYLSYSDPYLFSTFTDSWF